MFILSLLFVPNFAFLFYPYFCLHPIIKFLSVIVIVTNSLIFIIAGGSIAKVLYRSKEDYESGQPKDKQVTKFRNKSSFYNKDI